MSLRVLVVVLCACATSARITDPSSYPFGDLSDHFDDPFDRPQPNDLGRYEGIVRVTIDVLPEISRALRALAGNTNAEDPLDSENMLNILMAFMPVARDVMIAVAAAEGRVVSRAELQELERAEESLPAALRFMQQMENKELLNFGEEDGSASRPISFTSIKDGGVSGSFIRLPNQRGLFVHHG